MQVLSIYKDEALCTPYIPPPPPVPKPVPEQPSVVLAQEPSPLIAPILYTVILTIVFIVVVQSGCLCIVLPILVRLTDR